MKKSFHFQCQSWRLTLSVGETACAVRTVAKRPTTTRPKGLPAPFAEGHKTTGLAKKFIHNILSIRCYRKSQTGCLVNPIVQPKNSESVWYQRDNSIAILMENGISIMLSHYNLLK